MCQLTWWELSFQKDLMKSMRFSDHSNWTSPTECLHSHMNHYLIHEISLVFGHSSFKLHKSPIINHWLTPVVPLLRALLGLERHQKFSKELSRRITSDIAQPSLMSPGKDVVKKACNQWILFVLWFLYGFVIRFDQTAILYGYCCDNCNFTIALGVCIIQAKIRALP